MIEEVRKADPNNQGLSTYVCVKVQGSENT